jgi:hypothetical protein
VWDSVYGWSPLASYQRLNTDDNGFVWEQMWHPHAGWIYDASSRRNAKTQQALAQWRHAQWTAMVEANRQKQIAVAQRPKQKRLAEANRQKQIAAARAERQRVAAADARILSRWTAKDESRWRHLQRLSRFTLLNERDRAEWRRLSIKHRECITRPLDTIVNNHTERVPYSTARLTTQTMKLSGGAMETKRRKH